VVGRPQAIHAERRLSRHGGETSKERRKNRRAGKRGLGLHDRSRRCSQCDGFILLLGKRLLWWRGEILSENGEEMSPRQGRMRGQTM